MTTPSGANQNRLSGNAMNAYCTEQVRGKQGSRVFKEGPTEETPMLYQRAGAERTAVLSACPRNHVPYSPHERHCTL
jgi:hypothetical protein